MAVGPGGVKIWDHLRGAPTELPIVPDGDASEVKALSADGNVLVFGRPYNGQDHDLDVRSVATGALLSKIPNESRSMWSDALSATGSYFAGMVPGSPGRLLVWDLAAPLAEEGELFTGDVFAEALTFDADERRLAAAFSDGTTRIWDVGTRSIVARSGEMRGDKPTVIAFSPNFDLLAIGTLSGDLFLRVASDPERVVAELKAHTRPVHAVAFDPAGRWIATGADDGAVILWDLRSLRPVATLNEKGGDDVRSLVFDGSGQRFVVGARAAPSVWTTSPDEWAVLTSKMSGRASIPESR